MVSLTVTSSEIVILPVIVKIPVVEAAVVSLNSFDMSKTSLSLMSSVLSIRFEAVKSRVKLSRPVSEKSLVSLKWS
jgi:hypothetical protein